MSDDEPSVRVTLKQIYDDVEATKKVVSTMSVQLDKLIRLNQRMDSHSSRLRSIEKQISAQWVVHGLIIVAVGSFLSRMF